MQEVRPRAWCHNTGLEILLWHMPAAHACWFCWSYGSVQCRVRFLIVYDGLLLTASSECWGGKRGMERGWSVQHWREQHARLLSYVCPPRHLPASRTTKPRRYLVIPHDDGLGCWALLQHPLLSITALLSLAWLRPSTCRILVAMSVFWRSDVLWLVSCPNFNQP